MRHVALWYGSTAACALALVAATPALGQEAPVAEEEAGGAAAAAAVQDEFGDIVVTARRREENLQEVPISITAFNGDSLAQLGIQDTTDLEAHVPSLTIGNESIFSVYPNYGIRGQRNDSFLLQQAPTVITYFAGAPQGHPAGFGDTLFDIGSIQVLKGPQGTLFGKNSTGGAVVVEPARPEGHFSGNVYASYGNYDSFTLGGMLNLPLDDTLSLRVAGEHQQNDGYMRNRVTGQGLSRKNSEAFRASLLWEPQDGFSALTIFDYYRNDGSPGGARLAFVNTTPASQPGGSQLASRPALLEQVLAEYALQQSQRGNDRYEIGSGFGTGGSADIYGRPSMVQVENMGVTNQVSASLGDNVTLRNIASFRHIDTQYDTDYAGGNYFITSPYSRQNLRQFTEELQILGKSFSNRLDWVVGAFYFHEKGTDEILALNYLSRRYNIFDGTNISRSLYAQGTFSVTNNLRLTAGVRYNRDSAFARNASRALAATSPLFPADARVYTSCGVGSLGPTGSLVPLPLSNCQILGHADFDEVTWTGSVEYLIPSGAIGSLDRGLLYATARRGYRAGGFNVRATTLDTFGPYDPETVDDFEIGAKADWRIGGTRLRTNLALFYDRYHDLQRQTSIPVPGVPLPQGTISNAASSRVYGLEFEMQFIPFRGFEIGGYYNYINARYLEYFTLNRDGTQLDLSNNPFTRTPRHKFSINARYTVDLPNDSSLTFSGVYSWKDDEIFEDEPLPNGVLPTQPAFGLLNARIDWNNAFHRGLDLSLFVRNLTNKYYMTGFVDVSTSLGVAVFLPGEPRTWGVQARVRF
jgi:iron complex outermembrane receptor protein